MTVFLSGQCKLCSASFTYPQQKHANRRSPRLYCSTRCRSKASAAKTKTVRVANRQNMGYGNVKERTLKCEVCGILKTFDTDREGYALETCRCGTKFIGAIA